MVWRSTGAQLVGLPSAPPSFVHGRLQEHPEGDSRHEHWREVMKAVQQTRRRQMERRYLLR